MDLPLIVAPSPQPAGAPGTALPPANGVPADDGAVPVPGFAELLAAGLALPASGGELEPGADPDPAEMTSPEGGIAASAEPAGAGTPQPMLALVLAAIAEHGTAAAPAGSGSGDASPSGPGKPPPAGLQERWPPLTAGQPEHAGAPAQPVERLTQGGEAAQLTQAADSADPAPSLATAAAVAPSRPLSHAAAPVELRARVGATGWDAQVGHTIVWMAGERHQTAEVRLNPPDLGPLEIVLRLSGDDGGQASVTFASPHAEVRAALETALPRLREMLAESGITLGHADVNAESFRDAGDARRPGNGGDGTRSEGGGSAAPAAPAMRAGVGLVDIFA